MRVSGLYRQYNDDAESVPLTRFIAWLLFAVAIILGTTFFFMFERGVVSIL